MKKNLKRLFISCPIKGRELSNIKNSWERMHKIAEAMFDQKLSVINCYIYDDGGIEFDSPEKEEMYILAETIQEITMADYFIGIYHSDYWEECNTHKAIAAQCKIPSTFVGISELMPDAFDIQIEADMKGRREAINVIETLALEFKHLDKPELKIDVNEYYPRIEICE